MPKRKKTDCAPKNHVAEANAAFAFNLLQQLIVADPPTPVACSPFSVSVCLALLCAGAKGETKAQLERLLGGAAASDAQIQEFYTGMLRASGDFCLEFANKLCVKECATPLESFVEIVKLNYGGMMEWFRFEETEKLVKSINEWVAVKTHGLIKDMIQLNDVTSATTMILLNAVYFNGKWKNEFEELHSREEQFRITETKTKQVRMMRNHLAKQFHFIATEKAKVIRIPYRGEQMAMYAFLPVEFKTHGALFEGFEDSEILALMNRVKDEEPVAVMVQFPCMEVSSALSLEKIIQKLGIIDAFDKQDADFSGIVPLSPDSPKLYIEKIFQKTFIKTNEKGTVAASATRVQLATGSSRNRPPVFHFTADRPFFYFIVYESEMSVLFAGTFT